MADLSTTVISLSVRPLPGQVSHLCFEVDGVLGQLNTQLGSSVTSFNLNGFYTILNPPPAPLPADGSVISSAPTVGGDLSRLLYDPAQIQSFVGTSLLAGLRAEAAKIALINAINARQNAYFAKYGNAKTIISTMTNFFSPSVTTSKPSRQKNLSDLATQQADALQAAYTTDGRTGVVKTTKSLLNSKTTSSGSTTQTGQTSQESITDPVTSPPVGLNPLPPAGGLITGTITGPTLVTSQISATSSGQTGSSSGVATQSQSIVNTDYGYRTPLLESQAQNERSQISLIDQQFTQFMANQNLPKLQQVYQNELNTIDNNVYRLQLAYLNTILMSPVAGTVTGIYKNPGDAVKAGDPVIRVENPAKVLLAARLVFRGPIAIGSTIKVTTAPFDSQTQQTITAKVVTVRGQREDQQWDVIAQYDHNHDDTPPPNFPLGYNFDFDNTQVFVVS